MPVDPRAPVLVGVGTAGGRSEGDPRGDPDAVGLMVAAAAAAAHDAGDGRLLADVDAVLVPRGTWRHHDAARLVAGGSGATRARTLVAEIGVLQTTLIRRAAAMIVAGHSDIALVVGGEARWREVRAGRLGVALPSEATDGGEPDEVVRPAGRIVAPEEVSAGLADPVAQYAIIDNALRASRGQSLADHRAEVAALWERFNVAARDNPQAWNRTPMSAADIDRPGTGNRPMAFPYNKWHCSQWNVDQAAALLLCSAEMARARGIPRDRWVFPAAVAESDHMVPLSQRRDLHRSPGFALAGRAALDAAGTGVDDVAFVDLYSCFPAAVRVQAVELGLGERPLTLTGGMTFAGGPLNNYVLQATVAAAVALRARPEERAIVTAVSGLLTKQGVSIWSGTPPLRGFRAVDVSDEAAATPALHLRGAAAAATVAGYTVGYDGGRPATATVIAEIDGGGRSVAVSRDPSTAEAMTTHEWCGRVVALDGRGGFRPE